MGRGAAGMVVGIVPVEGMAIEGLPAEDRRQADAVERRSRLAADARQFEDRRRDVHRDHRLVARRARRRQAGPRDDERDAHAPLPGRSFAGAEGAVVGDRKEAAVIAGEEDRRRIAKREPVERIEDPTDGVVDALHHRRIRGVGLPKALLATDRLARPGLCIREAAGSDIRCLDVGLGLERGVDAEVGEIKKEGTVAVGLDEGHCLPRQPVGEVFPGRAIGERGDRVGGEIARGLTAVGAGEIGVEPLLLGAVAGAAEMPLADRRRGEAGPPQPLGHRHRLQRQVLLPVGDLQSGLRVFMAGDPVSDVEPGRRLTGHERRSCRRADGAGGVAGRKADPRGGEPVDVGRGVKTAPLTAEVESAQIVDEDHDHVGQTRRGLVGPAGERERRSEDEKQDERAHDRSRPHRAPPPLIALRRGRARLTHDRAICSRLPACGASPPAK